MAAGTGAGMPAITAIKIAAITIARIAAGIAAGTAIRSSGAVTVAHSVILTQIVGQNSLRKLLQDGEKETSSLLSITESRMQNKDRLLMKIKPLQLWMINMDFNLILAFKHF